MSAFRQTYCARIPSIVIKWVSEPFAVLQLMHQIKAGDERMVRWNHCRFIIRLRYNPRMQPCRYNLFKMIQTTMYMYVQCGTHTKCQNYFFTPSVSTALAVFIVLFASAIYMHILVGS